jgi:RecB family exonuclease
MPMMMRRIGRRLYAGGSGAWWKVYRRVVPDSARARAFAADAFRWCRTGAEEALLRLIRSSCSGVPNDVSAAYVTLGLRTGSLLDAIDRGRLALPPSERDAVLRFADRARRLRTLSENLLDEPLREAIAQIFELSRFGEAAPVRALPGAIELTEPATPESAGGVPGWQKHFSASALNTYAECARRWFYRYRCAAIEDPGSSASAYGTAVHLALQDFHGEFPHPRRSEESAMRNRIREYVQWAFERNREGFETRVEFELQLRRAQRTAQRYVDWVLAEEREAPFEVIGRELPTNLELGGRDFIGFIDRLDRDQQSGGTAVVDYKTGSIANTAQEYRAKVRSFRDFQLPFYYWARTAAGDRVVRLVLIPLKDALLDVRPIVLDVEPATTDARNNDARGAIGVAELERARSRMVELSGELASGTIRRFEPTDDPAVCTYCAYATACAGKPPPEAERFGW